MNVRFDSQSIRFRITEEDLNSLRKGESLFKEISADQGGFQFEILPKALIPKPMLLLWKGNRMVLEVSLEAIEELYNRGRSREGLRISQDSIDVRLEVDILSDKRARPQIHP